MFSTKNMKSRKGAMAGKTIAVAVIIIFIVAAVAGALYLTSSKHPTSSSKTTLTINWSLAGPEGKYMSKTVIPMFEKAYPNITVKYSTLSASTIISSLLSQESAHHVSVNIIEEDNLEMGALVSQGLVTPLNPYLSQLEAMNGGTTGTTSSGTIIPAYYKEGLFNGTYYFFPFRGNVQLAYYNQSALTKVGATVQPTNATNLMTDMMLLNSKGYPHPFNMQGHGGASTPTQVFQWMAEFGGNPMVFNDTGDIAALTYLQNMMRAGLMSPNNATGYWGSYKGLVSDNYQYINQWPYVTSLLGGLGMNNTTFAPSSGTRYNLGVAPVFAGPNNNAQYVVGGDVLGIPANSPNVWASLDWLKFVNSYQIQRDLLMNLSWPVVNELAYNNLPSSISYLFNYFHYEETHGIFRPAVPWMTQWNSVFDVAWGVIIGSNGNVTKALGQAHSSMLNYLKIYYSSDVSPYQSGAYYPSGNYSGPT